MQHTFIDKFNPAIELLTDSNRGLLKDFNAGKSKDDIAFTTFVTEIAESFRENYDGVTYLILNQEEDEKDVVGYYTISTKSLLLEDVIEEDGQRDVAILEIPALEIKMFAVDEKYQDIFFEFENVQKPVSAWVFEEILRRLDEFALCNVSYKAVFLRSVKKAEEFYLRNGFNYFSTTMLDTFSVDSDLKPMFHRLTNIQYNLDNNLVDL